MNLVKVAELLKNAPDQSLIQELNNPSGGMPSYMVLAELERRKKTRDAYQREQGAPQTSVAEDAEQEVAARMAPAMGIGSMPQAEQYSETAPQGYASGGEVKHYYGGEYVEGDYQDDLPWEERMRMWREMTGFGRMLPKRPEEVPVPAAPQTQPQAAAPAAPTRAPAPARNPVAAAVNAPTPRASANAVANETGIAASDVLARYRDLGAQQKAAYEKQAELYKTQADEIKKSKDTDIGFALMQAGLGIAGGRSANALENIAQGAQPAMQQYIGMDKARREQLQKLALGEGQLGIASLEAQMKPLEQEATYGQGERKLDIMKEQNAIDRMYKSGILARTGAAANMKVDPRIVAQGKAIEDEINDLIKMSEGMYGKKRDEAMARISALRQQKNALFNLGGADTGAATASPIRDYSEFMRR